MAEIDTRTVLAKLQALGHDYGPGPQVYKAELSETKCVVFNRRGMRRLVSARDILHHLSPEGGMSMTQVEAPEWDAKAAAKRSDDGGVAIKTCDCNVLAPEPKPDDSGQF